MRKQRKDHRSKVGLGISIGLHVAIVAVIFFWAAKTGRLDPILKQFDVVLTPKEKKAEQPKPKPIEQPKVVQPTPTKAPIPTPAVATAPVTAPPANMAPAVAPPAAVGADFTFADGAKPVESSTNAPLLYYKTQIEYALRSNWERPSDIGDESFVGEVEIRVDKGGRIVAHKWKKPSGDKRWDESVEKAIADTPTINHPPPPGFPDNFVVRFDVIPADPLSQ